MLLLSTDSGRTGSSALMPEPFELNGNASSIECKGIPCMAFAPSWISEITVPLFSMIPFVALVTSGCPSITKFSVLITVHSLPSGARTEIRAVN